jgi:archaellum component FlaG (FlaF/FlaG flagellin family)
MKKWILAFLMILLFSSSEASAQSYRGQIQGQVSDQSGAVVASANVTLLNVNTGIRTTRKTTGAGVYLFELLDPGVYTITVEAAGFSKFVQENIILQASNNITVNAILRPGEVQQSVTVSETPTTVQFTSSNQNITLNSTLATETPRYDRNPFKLTLLAREAINTRGEMLPFLSWSANSVDLGGGTNLKNDVQVDGAPVGLGHKFSYPPNMDAVESVNVSQNSTDAEFGHSAGGEITVTTKSGTNDWHGSTYYLGRYPWLNAIADRTTLGTNSTRQNMIGGSLGNPIIKRKLFNFVSLEYWKVGAPGSFVTTVPTAAEKTGDFSHTYNIDGTLRTVYDPWTTTTDPNTGTVTRQPFSGNIIPANRLDPLAVQLMNAMWAPNNPGDNITGVNNFKKSFTDAWNYWNWSDRVDYNIADKWKIWGRASGYHTTDITSNPTPNNSELYVPTGTYRTAQQYTGDVVWTVNPKTIVDFQGGYHNVVDAYVSTSMPPPGWAALWPNNPWYVQYQQASSFVPVYFPDFSIGGNGFGGRGFYWNQRPEGEDFSAKYSHQLGSSFLKAGLQWHHASGPVYVSVTSVFNFPSDFTANSYISPDTKHTGDPFGTFLLGALDNSSQMIGGPAPDPHTTSYGFWVQYDWRVNNRLTLNFGLRNEYEKAWSDPNHELSRGLDLSQPTPAMQANPPQMPAEALQIVGNNFYRWYGMWQWTDNNHPGMWDPPSSRLRRALAWLCALTTERHSASVTPVLSSRPSSISRRLQSRALRISTSWNLPSSA